MSAPEREPRDKRGPADPRDERDPRLEHDPRDERDPRRPGDPRNGRITRHSIELTALIIVLFLVDFFWSAHTETVAVNTAAHARATAIVQIEKIIASSCDFLRPLTVLPVTVPPTATKPPELSVQVIAGAREQYALQCTPTHIPLLPPSPSLVRWAAYYHIPVPS